MNETPTAGAVEARLDRLCTQIQETGEATDLPEYLIAAARRLGISEFVLTDLGVVLYRLSLRRPTARPDAGEVGGPFRAHAEGDGFTVIHVSSGQGWGVGQTFRKESVAREAAATLNALVELDRR